MINSTMIVLYHMAPTLAACVAVLTTIESSLFTQAQSCTCLLCNPASPYCLFGNVFGFALFIRGYEHSVAEAEVYIASML